MDLIRLYYDQRDIRPVTFIQLFMRFLGIYVEDGNIDTDENAPEYLNDIYIVSDFYMQRYEQLKIEVNQNRRPVLVFMDGWSLKNEELYTSIQYSTGEEAALLEQILKVLIDSAKRQGDEKSILDGITENDIPFIVNPFIQHQIVQSYVFTKCFYIDKELYRIAYRNYMEFLEDILQPKRREKDLFEFITLYTAYEVNYMCRRNKLRTSYSEHFLQNKCDKLLANGRSSHIALHLLRGDIYHELQEKRMQAMKEYMCIANQGNAYAWYKLGRLYKAVGSEPKKLAVCFEKALAQRPIYYQAWYQIAGCRELQGDYQGAVDAFAKIPEMLSTKRNAELLQPIEIEYIYKSYIRIASIYEEGMKDEREAFYYYKKADDIIRESAAQQYVRLMWDGFSDDKTCQRVTAEVAYHIGDGYVTNKINTLQEAIQ